MSKLGAHIAVAARTGDHGFELAHRVLPTDVKVAELVHEFEPMCQKAYAYLERTQILCTPASRLSPAYAYESVEMRIKYFRHVSEGGWPFSSAAHGRPISDCTAEGLKAVLLLRSHASIKKVRSAAISLAAKLLCVRVCAS